MMAINLEHLLIVNTINGVRSILEREVPIAYYRETVAHTLRVGSDTNDSSMAAIESIRIRRMLFILISLLFGNCLRKFLVSQVSDGILVTFHVLGEYLFYIEVKHGEMRIKIKYIIKVCAPEYT